MLSIVFSGFLVSLSGQPSYIDLDKVTSIPMLRNVRKSSKTSLGREHPVRKSF